MVLMVQLKLRNNEYRCYDRAVQAVCVIFFFKQKTAYEMVMSDWVQTCALPIFRRMEETFPITVTVEGRAVMSPRRLGERSEERRVGKECSSPCRSRGSPQQSKKNPRESQGSTTLRENDAGATDSTGP